MLRRGLTPRARRGWPRRAPRAARRPRRARASSRSGGRTTARPAGTRAGRRSRRPDRRVEPDQVAQRAADDRAERDRAPHDEPHRRVHPALHPRRGDGLAERDLVDVPGTLQNPPTKPEGRRADQISSSGREGDRQAGQAEPDRRSARASVRRRAARDPVRRSAPATRTPTDPTENANPIASGPEAALVDEVQDRGSRRRRCRRSSRCRSSRRCCAASGGRSRSAGPTAISWRIDGLGPCAASSCGTTGGSGRRIKNTKIAETT